MQKYISILRGINVGGKRKILMADLKALYEALGFKNPVTYIQSGNVIFETKAKAKNLSAEQAGNALTEKIKKAISEKYGFDVPVIIRSVPEIQEIIKQNPFAKPDVDIKSLHLTFLGENPSEENLEKIKTYDYSPDQFEIIGNNAFVFCSTGYSKSKLTNQFFEKKLKVSATTRNWKTVNKLLTLA